MNLRIKCSGYSYMIYCGEQKADSPGISDVVAIGFIIWTMD